MVKKWACALLLGALIPASALLAQRPGPTKVPPGTPVTIVVTQAPPSSPSVTIALSDRHGHATPVRQGCSHTGGGNTDIAQPSPDALVVTVTGVAVAVGQPCKASVAAFNFDLTQSFEVVAEKPEVKTVKLTLEGRVVGLLRSHCRGGGSAEDSQACATVNRGADSLLNLSVPAHAVTGGENVSINDRVGPVSVVVRPGKYSLHQVFHVSASHPRSLFPCKAASAEFAPDPALDPLWISYTEPFHGAIKKDLGFRITLKVAPEEEKKDEEKREPEKMPKLPD